MRGEIEASREHVYTGRETFREAGLVVDAAAGAQMIAFVELRAGAPDVAEARLREGIDELDHVEGFLTARSGAHAEGERLSTHAVEVAATIDMYESKARAYEWHARTLAMAGKPDEAREAASTARAIYTAKGDVPASAWATELVDSL